MLGTDVDSIDGSWVGLMFGIAVGLTVDIVVRLKDGMSEGHKGCLVG